MYKTIIRKLYNAINSNNEYQWKSKLEFAIQSLDATIWEYNLKKDLLFSDSEGSALLGGKSFEEYVAIHHPDDRDRLLKAFYNLINGYTDRVDLDLRLRQNDNLYIWIRIYGAVFEWGEKGSVRRIIGLRRNVQEQKEAQAELIESKRKLEEYAIKASLSLNSGDVFIWDYDVETETFSTYVQTSYMYGGVSKTDFIESVHIDDRAFVFKGLHKFIIERSTEPYTCKIRMTIPEKGLRWIELTATVLSRDSHGKPLALTGLKRDITDEHNMMEELISLRNKAEEANMLKTTFFANMSHEIRNPLNAILGFSNLIVETAGDESLEEYAKVIETNNELLIQLINDVLDLSKIETGKLDFDMSKICVNELMVRLKQIFQLRVKIDVEIILDTPLAECYINSDNNRLTQVLTNFLSNAVKYTSEGFIQLGYKMCKNGLHFYVKDTGKGIAEDNIPLVFNRFAKFDKSVEGAGLGLSICKMIVDKLGGKIGVESELGKGSKFWFTLPCKVN